MAVLAAMAIVCGSCVSTSPFPDTAVSTNGTIWSDAVVPPVPVEPDTGPAAVGTEFSPVSEGEISAVRFYQGSEDMKVDSATLWTSEGTALATVPVPEGPAGWREIPFEKPVPVKANEDYVVSYNAPRGGYPTDSHTFVLGHTVTSGWLTARGGVYARGSGFPNNRSAGVNYYVDVLFTPTGPTLRPIDGGTGYYDAFTSSLPVAEDFFPIGVWFTNTESAPDVAADRAMGLNTYVELTEQSNIGLIADSGMFAIPSHGDPRAAGRLTADEADMWAGAGDAAWTGRSPPDSPICAPAEAGCGYTVMSTMRRTVPPGVMVYANYGKGVTFWEPRDAAAQFVNDFQNVVSADNYWFTDPSICRADEGGALLTNGARSLSNSECRLASNYGVTTKYIRSLVQPKAAVPVWNFVEVGHPFAEGADRAVTGPEIRAAVWSSIINGARGIVYFNHNFGGPCLSYNVLRDTCGDAVRGDVISVNAQIRRLAPVLNAPFVDGFARTDAPIDLSAKMFDGSFYLMAGSKRAEDTDAVVTLSCGGATSVEVVDENRSIPVSDGVFRDDFADGNAVHIYRVHGGDTCGLR
ncbi:DUF4082 domain-containing protein [Rhodococcus sp. NPDC003348]